MRITILVNDQAAEGLVAEHGLSLWIEMDGRRILFDTGQGRALAGNARALRIDPRAADCVVLSHGHYDHGGGFPAVLGGRPGPAVYAHPASAQPRYSSEESGPLPVGLPVEAAAALARVPEERMHWVVEPLELDPGIGLTGPIPRDTGYEDTGGAFFLDQEGRRADPMEDDMAVWAATPKGLVVCVGCAHAGIVNTLRHALRVSGADRLRAVIGGFHLLAADEERMDKTIRDLQELDPEQVGPCHCTGDRAMERLRSAFGKRFIPVLAGTRLSF